MSDVPDTRYARTDDGLAIAYQAMGDGPDDVVVIPPIYAVDVMWEDVGLARFLRRMARIGRLVVLDYRGFGASDPVPLGNLPTPELWMDDLRAVLDTVGSSRCHLVVHGGGEFLGLLFAATYPDRVKSLTLMNATARVTSTTDYDIGLPAELVKDFVDRSVADWGTTQEAARFAPSRAQDQEFLRWLARYHRAGTSPGTHAKFLPWLLSLDMRAVLPSIRVPVLVVHRPANLFVALSHAQYLVGHIPNGQLVELSGEDYFMFTGNVDELADHIETFITGEEPATDEDRALATILFTDVVSSTAHAARLGDRQWRQFLDQHDALVARELQRHRGRMVNPTGDGLLAVFDGPARAVRCAQAIRDGVRSLGPEVRAGLHVGEVEFRGDDIAGLAVHIGQRIESVAHPNEVLVSRTVTDLVIGSGLEFEDRGEHQLKGLDGSWRLYALKS